MLFKAATHFASSTMVAWLKTSDEMTVIIKAFSVSGFAVYKALPYRPTNLILTTILMGRQG